MRPRFDIVVEPLAPAEERADATAVRPGGHRGPALRPCPFCGRAPRWERHPDVAEILRIACRDAGCAVQPATEFLLEEYADSLRSAWNARRG